MTKKRTLAAPRAVDPVRKVAKRLSAPKLVTAKGTPRQIADAALKRLASKLKIDPQLSDLKYEKVRETILGKHVTYQQYHAGKPVSGAWIRVDIDKDGHVYNVTNDVVPMPTMNAVRKRAAAAPARAVAREQLTEREAVDLAIASAGAAKETDILSKELCYFQAGGTPTLAWKVIVQTRKPSAEWKIYLDAANGDVLSRNNLLKQVTGKGRVFDPNPVAVLNDTSLKDKSTIPMNAYTEVELRDLKSSGFLDGPYVSTKNTPNRVKRTNRRFLFTRADRAFKEVMVYFHIDRAQRYIQELGFNNALNHPISVHIDGQTDDNSFYSPTTKALTFGTGGVDDAEDAEIILHEYGHALQDDQLPGFGASKEGKAMGEGFGDYLAASFFADVKPQAMRPTVGNWDAVSYSGAEPPCLRRLDSNKKYPKDINGEEHDDGEIWSSCLWEIRAALGRRTSDKLVLAHHFLLTPKATFEDGANALLTTDTQLNKGQNQETIRGVFVRRGILPNKTRKGRRAGVPFAETSPRARRRRPSGR